MDNPGEILRLCRLCLVKDQVNIPIFEEQGDIRQIFLKISSCLPVKVSRDDQLPKKICDGCLNKLDLLYEFWNTSVNAEKTLLSWLGQAGVKDADEKISAVAQQIAKSAETQVKQEALEDGHAPEVQSFEEEAKDESEAPPPKRARRTAAVKAQINITPESDDDDDMDSAEAMTKVEDESDESDGEDKDPSYGEVPGTSADDQAGPSGVGKDGVEAPSEILLIKIEEFSQEDLLKIEPLDPNIKIEHLDKESPNQVVKRYFCSRCGRTFSTKFNLKRHVAVHQDKLFQCSICPKQYKEKTLLQEHLKDEHAQNMEAKCEICDKTFSCKKSLLDHQKFHLEQYIIRCKICNKGFCKTSTYRDHMESKHVPGAYPCEVCKKIYPTKRNLRSHSIVHRNDYQERFFKECTICNKKYRNLVKHNQIVHSDKKDFVCDVCGKAFNDKATLKLHLMVHRGIRPHTCEVCGKNFLTNQHLVVHFRSHTGETPYECGFCQKRFTRRAALVIHERLHTGELPFQCKICNQGFRRKTYVVKHIQKHHLKNSS